MTTGAAGDLDHEDARLGVVALRGEERLAARVQLAVSSHVRQRLLLELGVLLSQVAVDPALELGARSLVQREEAAADDRDAISEIASASLARSPPGRQAPQPSPCTSR